MPNSLFGDSTEKITSPILVDSHSPIHRDTYALHLPIRFSNMLPIPIIPSPAIVLPPVLPIDTIQESPVDSNSVSPTQCSSGEDDIVQEAEPNVRPNPRTESSMPSNCDPDNDSFVLDRSALGRSYWDQIDVALKDITDPVEAARVSP